MIDDLVELAAPEGTYQVHITFHMNTETDVEREAARRGKTEDVHYLPDEMDRRTVLFRDDASGISKTFISAADPR